MKTAEQLFGAMTDLGSSRCSCSQGGGCGGGSCGCGPRQTREVEFGLYATTSGGLSPLSSGESSISQVLNEEDPRRRRRRESVSANTLECPPECWGKTCDSPCSPSHLGWIGAESMTWQVEAAAPPVPHGHVVPHADWIEQGPRDPWPATMEGLCCKPTGGVARLKENPKAKVNIHGDHVVSVPVLVEFAYDWMKWPTDQNCTMEWWEATNAGGPSGYDPPFRSGEWNPSHANTNDGKEAADRHERVQASTRRDERAGLREEPSMLDALDVPWSGNAQSGTTLDVFVRVTSACGACCIHMRYHYIESFDIRVFMMGNGCKECGMVPEGGGKCERKQRGSMPWTPTGSVEVGL